MELLPEQTPHPAEQLQERDEVALGAGGEMLGRLHESHLPSRIWVWRGKNLKKHQNFVRLENSRGAGVNSSLRGK